MKDQVSVCGQRNLNSPERFVIAHYRSLNTPKFCKIPVLSNLSFRPPDKRDHLKSKDTQFQSHVVSSKIKKKKKKPGDWDHLFPVPLVVEIHRFDCILLDVMCPFRPVRKTATDSHEMWDGNHAHYAMVLASIFNGSHFALPHSGDHKINWLGGKSMLTVRTPVPLQDKRFA